MVYKPYCPVITGFQILPQNLQGAEQLPVPSTIVFLVTRRQSLHFCRQTLQHFCQRHWNSSMWAHELLFRL